MKSCNYGDMQSSMLRDQIVFGIHNKKMRERLLKEDSLNLEDVIRMCRASEQTTTEAPVGVDRVVRARAPRSEGERSSNAREAGSDYIMNRRRCGGKHRFRQSPAYGKFCWKCRGKKRFAKVCLSASEKKQMGVVKRVLNIAKTERKVQSPQLNTRVTTLQADSWEAQYRNIFDGIGVLPFTYSIKLKDNARPVVHAPRRNPVPLRQDLRKELDRMV